MTNYDKPEDAFWADFNETAELLAVITHKVRNLGSLSMLFTALVVIASVSLSALRGEFYMNEVQGFLYSSIPSILAIGAVLYLFRLERLLRRGDALFEELTEELQFRISHIDAGDATLLRPPAKGRVIMREFPQARTLPFIPSRNAPGILLLINITFAALPFVLLAFGSKGYY